MREIVAADAVSRDDFHLAEVALQMLGTLTLDCANDYVLTTFEAAQTFVEHSHGFAHPRRKPQENLEPAALIVFFLLLDLPEQIVRVRPVKLLRIHLVSYRSLFVQFHVQAEHICPGLSQQPEIALLNGPAH